MDGKTFISVSSASHFSVLHTTLLLLYVDTIAFAAAHMLYLSTSLTSLAAAAQLVMQVQARMSQEMQAFWSVRTFLQFF